MLLALSMLAHAEPAYVRTPDLHGDDVVFAAIGDLWIVPAAGGQPRQLTTSVGDESQPSFSPDGSQVAFTGQYDGNSDVYVISSAGGEPVRLTWNPGRDEVIDWTPDGKVMFRTGAFHPHGSSELFTVSATGGDPEPLPLGFAARAAIGTDGVWALDRIGYERRTWKRYRGGMAGDLWLGKPGGTFTQVTETEASEAFPMWSNGRLYFLSDRGGTADLWSLAADGTGPKRHTESGDWDIRTPAVGSDGRIVFARQGDLFLFDPKTEKSTQVAIELVAERTLARRRYPDVRNQAAWFSISPEGDRVALVTRGEIFSVPVEDGVVLPITATGGARESWANYAPDGKRVVYVTDDEGEERIVTADAWGRGDVKVVKAAGGEGWHFWPSWSPDSKRIAWSDQTHALWVAPADGPTAPIQVDRSVQAEITDYVWSRDGRFLAYTKHNRLDYGTIWVWDSQTGKTQAVSTETTDDHSPAWDPEGRYLYYASERGTNPLIGGRDFEVVQVRNSRLVVVLLRKDVDNPFADNAGVPGAAPPTGEEKKKRKKKRQKEEEAPPDPKPVTIDWDGLLLRQITLPIPLGNYGALAATDDALFFVERPTVGMVEEQGRGTLKAWNFEEEELVDVLDEVGGYEIALKGEKLLVSRGRGGDLFVIDAKAGKADISDAKLDTAGVVVEIDPREEWRQIYFEAWRHERDFYWDASMAGIDWKGVRDRYATLLPRISSREELRDLLGELIGELGTSHTYVWGGDHPDKVDWVSNGMLGADFERDGSAYKVTRIYRGDPADESVNPLQVPGSVIEEGEYILAVNNRPFRPGRPMLAELEGKSGVPVLLTVNKTNTTKGARHLVITPIDNERGLRYIDWVRQNRERVAAESDGKFGYVHVPDMGSRGLVAFETWFYPQLDKQGLVIDVRWNGGGFVSQLLIERLHREIIGFDRSRGGAVFTYPYRVLNGPFVVLLNEFAGSDGDIFPKSVQATALAPVIGMRSWGGVVGIRSDKPLVDGGLLTEPEFAYWYPNGGWNVENHGVDPDIVVQNFPHELALGKDAQLQRGLEELTKRLVTHPPVVPDFGPAPGKSREAYRDELTGGAK